MVENAEELRAGLAHLNEKDGPAFKMSNDPRLTKLGRYLRRFSIDEWPQLWNVLKGDMSIVGPRPLVESTFNAYPGHVRKEIYKSKPGITGVGSIIFRDEEKLISSSGREPSEFYKEEIAPYKGEVELWYNLNKSLLTDIKLIFITAWVILFPDSNILYKWFQDLPKKQLST